MIANAHPPRKIADDEDRPGEGREFDLTDDSSSGQQATQLANRLVPSV